jgi:predicted SAM-dependent methyltransferase
MNKLHLGCGPVKLKGWVNVDIEGEDLDACFDLTETWPVEDSSVKFIYSEHVFEHLTPEEGSKALGEARRVLCNGGVIRTAMPDLDYLCLKYFEDWKQQQWIRECGYDHIRTKAEMLNTCFYFWGHRWIYNFEEFAIRLADTGFSDPQRLEFGKSSNKELRNLEKREDSKLVVEVSK